MTRLHRTRGVALLLPLVVGCVGQATSTDETEIAEALTAGDVTATLTVTSDWTSGYCADVTLKNAGTTKVTSWNVVIQMNQSTLNQIWSATGTTSGTLVTAKPVDYNATIAAGSSVSFGFCGTAGGTSYRPALVTLNVTTGGGGGSGGSVVTGSGGSVVTGSGGSGSGGSGSGGSGSGGKGSGGNGSGGAVTGSGGTQATGHYQMEKLNRGLVAVKVSAGVYVGWRMFGYEYDPTSPGNVSYSVYRGGTRIANVTNSTNYTDTAGTTSSTYTVRAVIGGVEQAASESASVWGQSYLRIPLQIPAGGTVPSSCSNTGEAYTYSANDGMTGDLDGDGQYEIVLKWDPSNAKDNSQSGCTGNVYLDAYKLNGTRLWRIDLGRNIRAGAHYSQPVVYDFDGDGRAEVAVKTAPGSRDGAGSYLRLGPAASDNDASDYRNSSGYILTGPEYLTVFSGPTGAELATANFDQARGTVSSWGDSYGNRVDRFLSSAAFVSDQGGGQTSSGRPVILMARGYYTRATISAWTWRDGVLKEIWKADSNSSTAYAGQGAHSMAVADVDGDGAQEIIYGSSVIDSNGTAKCSTGFGHGDALHVGDLVPSRAGLEVFMPHEDTTKPSYDVHEANTCAVIVRGAVTGNDTGRGCADDISSANAGAEIWVNGSGTYSATTGASVGSAPSSVNFLVWWDGDELRELENGTSITKYGAGTLLSATGCASNNGSKSTPVLSADLMGDWREEVIWRESDNSGLRIYTTTAVTVRRIYTLMHDPQYRMQVSSEQTAYNQPPHPSFHIGSGMASPPRPDIFVR